MKANSIIFILIFSAGVAIAKPKDPTKKDFKEFSKRASSCLQKKDKLCLSKLVFKRVWLVEYENLGCSKKALSSDEFSDCVFTSTKKYPRASEGSTLKEILTECFTDSQTKIDTELMNFETVSGYLCSVRLENGSLKIENVTLGD